MPAETLNCPMCGAPASTDAPSCPALRRPPRHRRLPGVLWHDVYWQKEFCSHCGAKAQREETAEAKKEMCPRCKVEMNAVAIGKSHLHECPHCEGVWVDGDTVHQICVDQEEQSAVARNGRAGGGLHPKH